MSLEKRNADLQRQGFIRTDEAARICGLSSGGNLRKTFIESSIEAIAIPLSGKTAKFRTYWKKSDVEKYAKSINQSTPHPVGGESNGGVLRAEIKFLKERVSNIELWIKDIRHVVDECRTLVDK